MKIEDKQSHDVVILSLRISVDLHEKIKILAKNESRSVNNYIATVLLDKTIKKCKNLGESTLYEPV